jgi:hypothetical protein
VCTRRQKFSNPGHAALCVILPLTHENADVILHGHLSAIHFYTEVHTNGGDLFSVL